MKNAFAVIAGCIVVLHLFCLKAAGQTVQAVEIHGNTQVSEETIRRIVRLNAGDPYTDEAITKAVKNLFATREFADVQAFKDVRGNQVVVTIVVKEYDKVDDVRFEGNDHAKDEDLAGATAVKKGAFIRPALLRNDHQAIEDLLREKGYYRVSVKDEVKVERDKDTRRTRKILIYHIDEGEKVSVKHVDFLGNRSLDSEEIKSVLDTKEDRGYRGADFQP